MPELPEVETTRSGISGHVTGQKVSDVVVRNKHLRWPVPAALSRELPGQRVHSVRRRAKYLLLTADTGCLILHLGMSGSLRILTRASAPLPHDHVDICFSDKTTLRFHDPRRFGSLLWTRQDPLLHPLLARLGPEPLARTFSGSTLHEAARGRKVAVKNFIMNASVVVGVGNIYASEALFRAGIHPRRPAGRIALARYQELARQIKNVLRAAIRAGGTTLRDFTDSDGVPGYFAQSLAVYGRAGEACSVCAGEIRQETIGQRSSFYCPRCQR